MKENFISWKMRGISLVLCILLLPGSSFAKAVKLPDTTEFPKAAKRSQIVRVLLSRLNIADRKSTRLNSSH